MSLLSPHADAILAAMAAGELAIVESNPGALGAQVAQSAGWDGQAACFRANETYSRVLRAVDPRVEGALVVGDGHIPFRGFMTTRYWHL